jgi:hypothetical protein
MLLSLLPACHAAQACLLRALPTRLTTPALLNRVQQQQQQGLSTYLLLTALHQQCQPQQMQKLHQMTTWALQWQQR